MIARREPAVTIGILGTGTMARAVARFFSRSGHRVVLGSRAPDRARELAGTIGPDAAGGAYEDAFGDAEVVVLPALWEDVPGILESVGPWEGRVLLDCSNPELAAGRGLSIGTTTSAAERIRSLADGARVVKALNHLYAEALDERGAGAPRPAAFYCGDDAPSKALVASLLTEGGLEPVDAGPLSSARFLEPYALLMVELVRGQGWAPNRAVFHAGGCP